MAAKKRKPTFTKAKQEEFLEHMRQGMRRGAAAYAIGLERKLVLDFILDHEDFEARVLDAEGEATEHVEEAIYQAAVSGSVPAAKLWMDMRKPKRSPLPSLMEDPSTDMGEDGFTDEDFNKLLDVTRE
jgi:hypothetical protein